ncbi:RNA-directed DNA polymerase, eukaryota, reverse transcriptase zinc-binding domain protein [Tanacetum coccineum]|uniref:RNA-directed DNA polymerase, eukaryota, reverse transcriptase zinc-binding domain protein n=1 Tax=Tanacetum coccineum TaxID=301880 RepID=A0ABQ5FYY0_9ASTR
MIGISLNSNGISGDNKKGWVRELVDRYSSLFLGIQESKLVSCDSYVVHSLWPHNYVEFAVSDSVGASGGILTMWDSRTFCMEHSFINRYFVGVVGSWVWSSNPIGLLNVYAPQDSHLKECLCEAWVFNDFISRTGLFDLPLGGRRFTRFDKDGRKASKLDRFLVSSNFFDVWNDASVSVLCRSFSDHCPLLIKVGAMNSGPKPFKVFDKWLMVPELDQHVRDDLRQKCRVKWAVEGDEITRFFRSLFKGKNSNSSIKGMLINGIWEDNPDVIKNAAIEHFSSRFKENGLIKPSFSNYLFRKLSEVDAKFLESGFSLEEVKESDVIKLDFWNYVKYFESFDKLEKGCNPSFMALILKKNDPLSFSDYRPIGCIYKVITKILASCLAKVIGLVIRSNQSAFIEGLKVNISKTRILGVGVFKDQIEAVASSIGCAHGTFPFAYLGLPVEKKTRLKEGWNAIIDRFRDKLSNWKAKNLSIGGRLTLVKSVLSSLPIYYLSLFKAPISIINSLEAIRCRFFWGCFESQRGIYWVKWNSILLDHKFGGLGIGSLLAKNYGLLCKWKWRFLSEEEALWRMVIKDFYGDEGGFNSDPKSLGSSDIWTEIIKVVNIINSNDEWCEDGRKLADAFPRLYALESFKDCRISDRWHMVNDSGVGNRSWIRPLRGRANDDLASLVSHIGRLHLNADGADKWVWSLDTSGSFKVSTLTKRIHNIRLAEFIIGDHHLWNSLVPRKVNICVWRASLNRLPTRVNLNLRGINMASNLCPFCNTCVDDIEHCLINCSHSLAIWRKIWSWWNMPSPLSFPCFSIKDIALGNIGLNGSSRISKPDAIAKIKGEDIFPSIQSYQ